jgi:hypothetical protein
MENANYNEINGNKTIQYGNTILTILVILTAGFHGISPSPV